MINEGEIIKLIELITRVSTRISKESYEKIFEILVQEMLKYDSWR